MEVSFHSSLETSNKSEQFTGRSGIQKKLIGLPRIIENERLKPDSFSGVRHKFMNMQTFYFLAFLIAAKRAILLNIIMPIPILGFNALCQCGVRL